MIFNFNLRRIIKLIFLLFIFPVILFPAAALSEEIEEFPEWLQDASPYICAVTAQEMSDVYRNDVFEVCFSGFIEFCKLGYSIEECNLIGSGILNADNNNYLSRLNLSKT